MICENWNLATNLGQYGPNVKVIPRAYVRGLVHDIPTNCPVGHMTVLMAGRVLHVEVLEELPFSQIQS